jgi:hypothetical protein
MVAFMSDLQQDQKPPQVVEIIDPVIIGKTTAKRPSGQHKSTRLHIGEEWV